MLHSIEDFENLNYAILTANNNNVANRIGLNTFYVTDVGHEQYILSMHYRGGAPFKNLRGGGHSVLNWS